MRVRVAELVGGLSLATDMGAGLPLQTAICATIMATRMAQRLGLSEDDQRVTYYAAILRFIGCSSVATEAAQLGAGDDMGLNYALGMCDMAEPEDVARALDKYWNPKADPRVRREVIKSLSNDLSQVAQAAAMHCTQAVVLSKRMPVHAGVPGMLEFMYDRFDGMGSNHSGEDIPIPARLCNLACDTIVVLRSLGKATALEMILPRSGGQFCPECVELLQRDHAQILEGLDAPSCWDAYLDLEPGAQEAIDGDDLETVCTAYADFGDQKSGFLLGHSRHVANLGTLAAMATDVDAEERRRLRLAALLHDVGRAGVPTGLWDKPGPLGAHERQIMEGHNAHTETVLRLSPHLRELAHQAGGVHERSNGAGYPRSVSLNDQTAGVLAAADVYEALTHERPWRRAYSADAAANILLDEAKEDRLPRRAVAAVLDAAGHGKKATEAAYPAGLTHREVQVLALLAAGMTNAQIADRLEMSPKTAENHVGHVYDKTEARGRAAAALFAVEHGLTELI